MMKCPIWLQQIHRFPGPGVTPPEKVCQDPVVSFHPRKEELLEACLAERNKVKSKCQRRAHGFQFLFFFAHILSEKVNIKNFTFTPKRQHLCMPRFSAPTDFDQDRIFLFLYIFSGHRR